MDRNTGRGDFDIQNPEDAVPLEIVDGGVVEDWEPLRLGFGDFDIQDPEAAAPARIERAGKVETWRPIYAESRTRQFIAFCIVGLFVIWTLLGLGDFLVTGSAQLLQTNDPLLVGLLGAVIGYYFGKQEERHK